MVPDHDWSFSIGNHLFGLQGWTGDRPVTVIGYGWGRFAIGLSPYAVAAIITLCLVLLTWAIASLIVKSRRPAS